MWWIRQAILKASHHQGNMIRVPAYLYTKYNRHLREQNGVTRKKSSSIEPEMDEEESELLSEILRRPLSLDSGPSDDGMELHEVTVDDHQLTPEDRLIQKDLWKKLRASLEELPDREQLVLRLRSGMDLPDSNTLQEIGDLFNLSKERIRQIESRAIKQLSLML
jgi:RNA polymerase primary sigma factor